MMCTDPGALSIYLWFHITILFIVGAMWLYGYGEEDPYDKNDKPVGKDEIDPDIW